MFLSEQRVGSALEQCILIAKAKNRRFVMLQSRIPAMKLLSLLTCCFRVVSLLVFGATCSAIPTTPPSCCADETSLATTMSFGEDNGATCVEFSPAGQMIAAGTKGGEVRVWKHLTGETVQSFRVPGDIQGIAWSPDGRFLATASTQWNAKPQVGHVRMFRVNDGSTVISHELPDGLVLDAAFSSSGKTLVASGQFQKRHTYSPSGWRKFWKVETGAAFDVNLAGERYAIGRIAIDVKSNTIIGATKNDVCRWTTTGEHDRELGRRLDNIHDFDLSSDSTHIAVAGAAGGTGESGGRITIRDLSTNRRLTELHVPGVSGPFTAIAFSPDGNRLAAGTSGGNLSLAILNVSDGSIAATFDDHKKAVTGTDFSPDGSLVATSSLDGTVRIRSASSAGTDFWLAEKASWNQKEIWVVRTGRNSARLSDRSEQNGSAVTFDDLGELTSCELNIERLTAKDLTHLRLPSSLRSIRLVSNNTSPLDISFLASLTRLKSIDLSEAHVMVKSLNVLSSLPRLSEVTVGRQQLQPSAWLGSLASLQQLTVDAAEVPEVLLDVVRNQNSISHLRLTAGQMMPAQLDTLSEIPHVTSLHLGTITDAALQALCRNKYLRRLAFDASNCSAAELIHLAEMNELEYRVIANGPFPPTAIPYLITQGKMTRSERTDFYRTNMQTIQRKLADAARTIRNDAVPADGLLAAQLQGIETQIDFRRRMARQYPEVQSIGGGFLGGLYDSAESSGNFAARQMIAKEINELQTRRQEIVEAYQKQQAASTAGLTAEERAFASAFGLISF